MSRLLRSAPLLSAVHVQYMVVHFSESPRFHYTHMMDSECSETSSCLPAAACVGHMHMHVVHACRHACIIIICMIYLHNTQHPTG